MNNLAVAIQWREDVESGVILSDRNYNKQCCVLPTASPQEMVAICAAVNLYYTKLGSKLRVDTQAGELIPITV